MKGLVKAFEGLFAAIAFAEAGEFDTAREILRQGEKKQRTERISSVIRSRKEVRAPGIKR